MMIAEQRINNCSLFRMMVVGLGMDVVVIFDIIEYGVLLLDRIKKGLG